MRLLSLFKERDDLFATDALEILKKFINRIAALEIVDQVLNRNTRAGKARRTAHDFRINLDYRAHLMTPVQG